MTDISATPISAETLAELLVSALDLRERETGQHSKRVACHTMVLARQFYSDVAILTQIYWGALLHDIGKIGISDAVLLKNGPLNEIEWAQMREHPRMGYQLLAQVPGLRTAAEMILHHEERFDGSGYPAGLKGGAIPFPARLFAVIDTLDAIVSDRPYRPAQTFDVAFQEIRAQAGRQFDPLAVAAFQTAEEELRLMVERQCGPQMNLHAILGHVQPADPVLVRS